MNRSQRTLAFPAFAAAVFVAATTDGARAQANDNCAAATPVAAGSYSGSTAGATNDGSAACGASTASPDVWYRFKLTAAVEGGKGVIRGKVWPKSQKEPAEWSVEVNDEYPIGEGSAALYGYVPGILSEQNPGPEVYFDNVRITPNKK